MLEALGMRVLVARGRRVSLLLVRERSRGLLVHEGSRAATIRARDMDSRVSGQHSPSQLQDRRGYSIFLHNPVQARGASFSFRELHGHLPLHRQAREARV